MADDQILILTEKKIGKIITRIAYQIYESNFLEKEIHLVGIWDRGFLMATMLKEHLEKKFKLDVPLAKLTLDKVNPLNSQIELDVAPQELEGKCVILVDDVLNTGKTLMYSLKPLLEVNLKKLEIAVLVNRSHTRFPISVAYSGYALSTTINEHIEVRFEESSKSVYLH